jgi:hypothetical protein
MTGSERQGTMVDDLLDDFLPEGVDWEGLVRKYPLPALALAAAGGFFLGLRHGTEIVSALSGFAASEVSKNVSSILGQELG